MITLIQKSYSFVLVMKGITFYYIYYYYYYLLLLSIKKYIVHFKFTQKNLQ